MLLSTSAFKFSLCRYTEAEARAEALASQLAARLDVADAASSAQKLATSKPKSKSTSASSKASKLPALSKLNKAQLVAELAGFGVDTSGVVTELRVKLRDARAAAAAGGGAAAAETAAGEAAGAAAPVEAPVQMAEAAAEAEVPASGVWGGSGGEAATAGAAGAADAEEEAVAAGEGGGGGGGDGMGPVERAFRAKTAAKAAAAAEEPGTEEQFQAMVTSTGSSGKGYYQSINGKKYDRKVLDDCRRSMNNDGIIDLEEARMIVLDVLDGPRRQVRAHLVPSYCLLILHRCSPSHPPHSVPALATSSGTQYKLLLN